jgi:hypothetical protein
MRHTLTDLGAIKEKKTRKKTMHIKIFCLAFTRKYWKNHIPSAAHARGGK